MAPFFCSAWQVQGQQLHSHLFISRIVGFAPKFLRLASLHGLKALTSRRFSSARRTPVSRAPVMQVHPPHSHLPCMLSTDRPEVLFLPTNPSSVPLRCELCCMLNQGDTAAGTTSTALLTWGVRIPPVPQMFWLTTTG